MFSGAHRKAAAPRGPHDRGSLGGDGRDHGRQGRAGPDCRAPDRAGDERGAARRDRRPRADHARPRRPACRSVSRRCSTRAAPAATARTRSTSRPWPRWWSRRAACASPSTAIDRCRAAAAAPTCSRRSACKSARRRRSSSDASSEAGIAFFLAPTFHPSMRHAGRRPARSWACAPRSTCSGR